MIYHNYDVVPESEITPCIKINKPLLVYRFSSTLSNDAFNLTHMANPYVLTQKYNFKLILMS